MELTITIKADFRAVDGDGNPIPGTEPRKDEEEYLRELIKDSIAEDVADQVWSTDEREFVTQGLLVEFTESENQENE